MILALWLQGQKQGYQTQEVLVPEWLVNFKILKHADHI